MSNAPSPIYPDDPNYSGQPYVIDLPAMTGDIDQTLASLISLRLNIIQAGPKPDYDIHGHRMNFKGLMQWFNDAIEALRKESLANHPYESVSVAR